MIFKRFSYTPILGWSVSRYGKFKLCKRQYYYDYYAKYDSEFPRQKIDSLKKMTSIAMESGSIVHDVIKVFLERLLVSEKPVDEGKFIEFAKKMVEDTLPKRVFTEVYYQKIPHIDKDEIFETVRLCLLNFIRSDRYSWTMKEAVQSKNEWIIEPPGYGETRINNLKAYCKVDFLFPIKDKTYILDWKTGKKDEEKHKKQLLGYTSWASFHFGIPAEKIVPIIAYLKPDYEELECAFSQSEADGFVNRVESETKEMYSYLVSAEENLPKEKDNFPLTQNIKVCAFCNYRELCGINA